MPAPDYSVEIAALRAGLASGEARVASDGDEVTYRGVTDIMRAISYFESLVVTPRRSATTLAVFDPR